jgi:hypothetical protein
MASRTAVGEHRGGAASVKDESRCCFSTHVLFLVIVYVLPVAPSLCPRNRLHTTDGALLVPFLVSRACCIFPGLGMYVSACDMTLSLVIRGFQNCPGLRAGLVDIWCAGMATDVGRVRPHSGDGLLLSTYVCVSRSFAIMWLTIMAGFACLCSAGTLMLR